MFSLIVLSLCLCGISAHFYPNYGYGYDKGYGNGYKKGGYGYESQGYLPNHYGNDNGYGQSYGQGYGHGYGYKKFNYKPYNYGKVFVKRLPPIYKHVKVPVIVEQPVIIKRIPVFKKRKEVTVKNLPPVYEHEKPTVVEKEVGVGLKPELKDMKPMYEFEDKPMYGFGGKPLVGYEMHKKMMNEYPKMTKEGMSGVEYEEPEVTEGQEEEKGEPYDEIDLDKTKKKEMMDMLPMEMKKEMMEKMMKKMMEKSGESDEDSFLDFDPKDFGNK